MKKCFVNDPDTNLGVPVELTAADVRPYFEHQEIMGRIPASDFATHIFDTDQNLPHAIPTGQLKEDLPVSDLPRDKQPESSPEPVPTEPLKSATAPPEPQRALEAPVAEPPSVLQPPVKLPRVSQPPARLPTIPEDAALDTEAAPEQPTPRRRGRPPGRKNKPRVCPRCTDSFTCVAHCENCKGGLACNQHTVQDRCAKCTRTRPCAAHR